MGVLIDLLHTLTSWCELGANFGMYGWRVRYIKQDLSIYWTQKSYQYRGRLITLHTEKTMRKCFWVHSKKRQMYSSGDWKQKLKYRAMETSQPQSHGKIERSIIVKKNLQPANWETYKNVKCNDSHVREAGVEPSMGRGVHRLESA